MTDAPLSVEEQVIAEVEAYSRQRGLSPSTVCVRATGNSRLLARMRNRAKQTADDVTRLRRYMACNPVEDDERGAA